MHIEAKIAAPADGDVRQDPLFVAAQAAVARKAFDEAIATVAGITPLQSAEQGGAALVQLAPTEGFRVALFDHLAAARTPVSVSAAHNVVERAAFAAMSLRSIDGNRGALVRLAQSKADEVLDPDEIQFVALVRAVLADDAAESLRVSESTTPDALVAARLLAARVLASARKVPQAIDMLRRQPHPSLQADLRALETYRENGSLHLQDHRVSKPGCRIAICAVLKNESDDIEEWIAFHHRIGVERFYLYENMSTDATWQKLQTLKKHFPLRLHRVPDQPAQAIAYRHFLAFHRLEASWTAFIDGDEFINLAGDETLGTALDSFGDASAVACNWKLFGSNGHRSRPEGGCLHAFTRRASSVHPHVKMLVRPNRVVRYLNPHHFIMDGPIVNGAGCATNPLQGMVAPPDEPRIGINHYIVKSYDQWLAKQRRGRPVPEDAAIKFRDDSYFTSYDRNDVEDLSILRHIGS